MSASLILSASGNNGRQIGSLLAYRESLTGNGVIGIEFPFTRTTSGMELLQGATEWTSAVINMPRRYYNGTKYSYLFEPARTNLFLNSAAPVTQNITVVSGQQYTITVFGVGTATLSGAATGTVTGTNSDGTTLTVTTSGTTLTVTMSGVSGAQTIVNVELGSSATSPIITTGSAVLRAADVPQLTGASALIGQTEGTLFSHFELTNLSGDRTILEIGADNNNRIRLRINGNTLSGNVVVGGVSVGVVQFNGITLGIYKLAYTYKNNEFKAYLNGVAGTPSLSGSIPSNMSIIAVGTRLLAGGADYFNDRVIESKVYPTSLSNAELAALTTL